MITKKEKEELESYLDRCPKALKEYIYKELEIKSLDDLNEDSYDITVNYLIKEYWDTYYDIGK